MVNFLYCLILLFIIGVCLTIYIRLVEVERIVKRCYEELVELKINTRALKSAEAALAEKDEEVEKLNYLLKFYTGVDDNLFK